MDLRINTTPAKMGVDTIPYNVEISQPKADFDMNIEQATVDIDFEHIKVQIDQYQCFAEIGLKNYADLTKDYVNLGKQKAMESITKAVSEGNRMQVTRDARQFISTTARQNYFEANRAELTIEALPKTRPKIDFTGGDVNIEANLGEVEINTKPNKPVMNFTPGSVDVYLEQKGSVDIEYVGNVMDMMI